MWLEDSEIFEDLCQSSEFYIKPTQPDPQQFNRMSTVTTKNDARKKVLEENGFWSDSDSEDEYSPVGRGNGGGKRNSNLKNPGSIGINSLLSTSDIRYNVRTTMGRAYDNDDIQKYYEHQQKENASSTSSSASISPFLTNSDPLEEAMKHIKIRTIPPPEIPRTRKPRKISVADQLKISGNRIAAMENSELPFISSSKSGINIDSVKEFPPLS